jgi:hypothetical protein
LEVLDCSECKRLVSLPYPLRTGLIVLCDGCDSLEIHPDQFPNNTVVNVGEPS